MLHAGSGYSHATFQDVTGFTTGAPDPWPSFDASGRRLLGVVPNMFRVIAASPGALTAFTVTPIPAPEPEPEPEPTPEPPAAAPVEDVVDFTG